MYIYRYNNCIGSKYFSSFNVSYHLNAGEIEAKATEELSKESVLSFYEVRIYLMLSTCIFTCILHVYIDIYIYI